ncbi:MAG TPA: hypothetical protein VFH12_08980 [Pseudoxanthomonas sp.]|nr:hypothetical protein [Pseudoxanthomonas sp.]
MTEYSHTMLVRGRYQIVALTDEAQFDPADVTGYAVLSPSGEKLRHEPSLEEARLWADRLIEEEAPQRSDPAPPASARAVKRRR